MDRNLRAALIVCKGIEELCAQLYYIYAEAYAKHPPLAGLWRKTADDEVNHASIIKLALNCRDLRLEGVRFDVEHYRAIEQAMRAKVEAARRQPPPPVDALRDAVALERRLMECHLLSAAQFVNREEGRLFESLSSGDRAHLAALEEALAVLSRGEPLPTP